MSVTVSLARPSDDEGIRGLLRREPLPGRVRVAFCREPNFSIGCSVTGEEHQILVARSCEGEEIVGVACRSIRRVFLNGQEEQIGYLGHLRIDRRFRGRWLVSRGFSLLEQLDRARPVPAYLVSIVDGNREATGVLVRKRRRSFPVFRGVAGYCTLALRTRRPKPVIAGSEESVTGSADQMPEVVRFLRTEGARRQLFPAWTPAALDRLGQYGLRVEDIRIARRDGVIVGVMALWDQSAYKQAIVRGYSGWLKLAAPLLPRVGMEVRSACASLVCIAHDDPAIFRRMLRDLYDLAVARRFDYLLVGADARDPLLQIAREYPHITYPSQLYLASWTRGGRRYDELDDRLAYVDVATL